MQLRRASLATLTTCALVAPAYAFEIETPVSEACHEEVTLAAAREAGFPAFAEAPTPTEDQRRAMNDLVFTLPADDPWSLALFIGVRSNDLRDNAPTDLAALVHVHDDPADQPAHCMRRQVDDGAAGDVTALAACKAFIVGELSAGGLLENQLDLDTTEEVSSYFNFRGTYTLALPAFAYHLGRALHALQDAHTHSMRDAESGEVVHVLNWIEAYGSSEYAQDTDGYPHLAGLDTCRDVNSHQQRRIELATAATTRVLEAIAGPMGNRRDRVLAAIGEALVLRPGCDASNDYCNAPELAEPTGPRTFGCSTAGGGGTLALGGLALALVLARRRRLVAVSGLALALAVPSAAQAQPAPTQEPSRLVLDESTGDEAVWHQSHWHFDARLGGSVDDPGLGGMIGAARTEGAWTFGLLAEWNPWFSFDNAAARPGVFNIYGTAAYRWFKGPRLSIATRIEAGSSTMLFELLGIDKFTTGVYLGGALATVRFPLGNGFALTWDPIHFALPAPRPFGLPFYYKQYRTTVGIEIRL